MYTLHIPIVSAQHSMRNNVSTWGNDIFSSVPSLLRVMVEIGLEPLAVDRYETTSVMPKAEPDAHGSLKYHLLGPSLTKAGQDCVDQQKV